VNTGRITVFGGAQKRPNIHIEDVTDLYVRSLEWPEESIDGQIFNAGYENHTVAQLADMVAGVVGREKVQIVTTPTDDHRSYHISSERIKRALGFEPGHTVEEAVRDLSRAYAGGLIPDAMTDKRYYNIKTMLEAKL
jgi:nucleoside-diphosphate-sugar epimerase